jgi:hypothetical protein
MQQQNVMWTELVNAARENIQLYEWSQTDSNNKNYEALILHSRKFMFFMKNLSYLPI